MKEWINPISDLRACQEALDWAEQYDSMEEAWQKCERGDWMLWLAGKMAGGARSKSRRTLVLAACSCARLALPYVEKGETRPLEAIETAEAWARREPSVTLGEVIAAANAAAYAAAYAANDTTLKKKCACIVRQYYPTPIKTRGE